MYGSYTAWRKFIITFTYLGQSKYSKVVIIRLEKIWYKRSISVILTSKFIVQSDLKLESVRVYI
jgi:hypothetical protein